MFQLFIFKKCQYSVPLYTVSLHPEIPAFYLLFHCFISFLPFFTHCSPCFFFQLQFLHAPETIKKISLCISLVTPTTFLCRSALNSGCVLSTFCHLKCRISYSTVKSIQKVHFSKLSCIFQD